MTIRLIILMGLILVAWPALADEDPAPEPQRLFHIERNTNANIVVYDAMLDKGGSLKSKEPIDVYWLRLAEDGARKGLSRIERRMAYGYKEKKREADTLVIEMRANIGRLITVVRQGDEFRARIDINGQPAFLDMVFIHVKEGGALPSVTLIELNGTNVESGDPVLEKFKP